MLIMQFVVEIGPSILEKKFKIQQWATSLTWQTSWNQWIYLSKAMITSIYIMKMAQ